jgi:hypothetical protein
MHIHNVYFWLEDKTARQTLAAFELGLAALTRDPAVTAGYFGPPANTHRDVVENSYNYGLVLIFGDIAAHDRYQVGEVHQKFLADHRAKWKKVVVYDVETC